MIHPRLLELERQFLPSPLQRVDDNFLIQRDIELWIKRDDLLHPIISGNKWRKLKYCLDHALQIGAQTLVSMGGAHSNHLHALAYAGYQLGLNTRAYVRGEELVSDQGNPTLNDLRQWGMSLQFISRSDYRMLRDRKQHDQAPNGQLGDYWLAEGGASLLALQGVAEIIDEIEQPFDLIAVACGTATTLAGLIAAAPQQQFLGVAALKGGRFLYDDVRALLGKTVANHWQIVLDAHHGGFGRITPELSAFIESFQQRQAIPLEPIYTGKLVFAIYRLVGQGVIGHGTRVLVLHTGGLQGSR